MADKNTTQPPEQSLATHHYRMRPIEISDAEHVAVWYQDIEDVSIFDRQLPLPINTTKVSDLIRTLVVSEEGNCRWFIAETKEGAPVGIAGLEAINMLHGHAILPLFIAQPWRRSGIGIRIACMMIDLAFKQLRMNRITTMYRSDNLASEVVLNRLGFTVEGTSRQAWFSQGEYRDVTNVGLLVTEWRATRLVLREALDSRVTVALGPDPSDAWCWPGK
ncbi:hypothetical protein AB833_09680 [Chromatiales bacterium (ex Bugula neritina AB1)]|nr:hypothetical protein AB833_09680 [Chromatiales bacterium (ex Bugula neritina AB1)]